MLRWEKGQHEGAWSYLRYRCKHQTTQNTDISTRVGDIYHYLQRDRDS
jgi:hypothetical protein